MDDMHKTETMPSDANFMKNSDSKKANSDVLMEIDDVTLAPSSSSVFINAEREAWDEGQTGKLTETRPAAWSPMQWLRGPREGATANRENPAVWNRLGSEPHWRTQATSAASSADSLRPHEEIESLQGLRAGGYPVLLPRGPFLFPDGGWPPRNGYFYLK